MLRINKQTSSHDIDQSLQNEGLPSSLTELHERLVTSSHSDQLSMPVPIHILNTNEVQVIFYMIEIAIEALVFCSHPQWIVPLTPLTILPQTPSELMNGYECFT